jgi:two-component sensor histidine kinase
LRPVESLHWDACIAGCISSTIRKKWSSSNIFSTCARTFAGLLGQDGTSCAIVVEGEDCEIPTLLGIPLGFIVNELITNSAKYAKGTITVRVEKTSPACHALSVVDDGPGLPPGFDPAKSKGLGMKIVQSLVKQIGGELHILPGDNGCGARFTVTF